MKITPWFTHPQAILDVYDFLLSDKHNQSYIKICPGSSKLYNGSEFFLKVWKDNVRNGLVLSCVSVPVLPYLVTFLSLFSWLLVDSLHLSVPHYPVFISPSLFSLCWLGLLVFYVCLLKLLLWLFQVFLD